MSKIEGGFNLVGTFTICLKLFVNLIIVFKSKSFESLKIRSTTPSISLAENYPSLSAAEQHEQSAVNVWKLLVFAY